MLKIKTLLTFFGIFIVIGIVYSQPVNLAIQNVDTAAGTLDIYMVNQAGCQYWVGTEVKFDATISESNCTGDSTYIDGRIAGFQFELIGIDFDDFSGGTAEAGDFTVMSTAGLVIGFTIAGDPLSPGEGVLTQVSFSGYDGSTICFGTNSADNVISDSDGIELWTEWGNCWCSSESGTDLYLDDCGICNGENASMDTCGVCDGNNSPNTGTCDCSGTPDGTAEVDCAGTCDGTAVVNNNGDCLSIVHISSNPSEFTISQNYPNPFNPITSISFDVAEMDEISLIVYDLLGKEVITLASGTFVPGRYIVNWNAVNNYGDAIASGMYVYRYISNDNAITRKMLFLK